MFFKSQIFPNQNTQIFVSLKHKYFKRDLLPYVFNSNITTYLPPIALLKIAKAAPPDDQQPEAPTLLQAPATERRGHTPHLHPSIGNAQTPEQNRNGSKCSILRKHSDWSETQLTKVDFVTILSSSHNHQQISTM